MATTRIRVHISRLIKSVEKTESVHVKTEGIPGYRFN